MKEIILLRNTACLQFEYFCVVHLLSKRTYLYILKSVDNALFKMVRYVLLRPLRPEVDAKTKTCLPAKTRLNDLKNVKIAEKSLKIGQLYTSC
jgi:hypothetical protein